MVWDDSYSVGIGEIDLQHQRLMSLINQLHGAMLEGKGKDVLGSILKELVDYTVVHFGLEEKYFDEFGYEDALEHKGQHKEFVDKVSGFRADFEAGNVLVSVGLMDFLKKWLANHIRVVDKKYVECFRAHGLR